MSEVVAIVLAAGRASRFGGTFTKVLAPFAGEVMVRRVALAALGAGLKTLIVCGYQAKDVHAAVADLHVTLIDNPDFQAGMSTSLRAGLGAAGDAGAALVLLADMPRIDSALIVRLCAAFRAHPEADAVVPVYRGERGNPVLLSRRLFGEVSQLSGDSGARKLLAGKSNVVELTVPDEAILFDVDTPAKLEG